MKVTAEESKRPPEPPQYPWIGMHESSNRVVIFTGPRAGFCLQPQAHLGYSESWNEHSFTIFNGKITIEN